MRVLVYFITFLFIVINPMTEAGRWCLDELKSERGDLPRNSIFLDCKVASERLAVPYSEFPTTVPAFSGGLDILCLLIFSGVKYDRYRSRKNEQYTKYRDMSFAVLTIISIIDIIVALILFKRQYIANIIRPFIVVLMFQTQQDFFGLLVMNTKDSFAMILCILLWILYFAMVGNFLFKNQLEGLMVFDTFSNSYWALFICITTENYPDVMLLA